MPYDDRLFEHLRKLSEDDLTTIWTTGLKMKPTDKEFLRVPHESKVERVSAELRSAAGHSMVNVFRDDHELPWRRILIDAADKMKPGWNWTRFKMEDEYPDAVIEDRILRYADALTRSVWEKMSEAEQEAAVASMNQALSDADQKLKNRALVAGATVVTREGLTQAVSAGLLTGGGVALLMQGTASALVGGLLGGVAYQIGLWVVVQLFGWWAGLKLILWGGAAWIGGAVIAAPAIPVAVVSSLAAPSYRKTIPSVVLILTSLEVARQLASLESDTSVGE